MLCQGLTGRLRELETVLKMLGRIEDELRCSARGTDEILAKIAADKSFSELVFLKEYTKINTVLSPGERFSKALERASPAMLLNSGDLAGLKEFGLTLGTTDLDGQLKNIRLCQSAFERETQLARVKTGEKCRLYRSLSVLGACAAAILMI